MTDFIRVKDNETGHEYSVPTSRFDGAPDLFTKVDKVATDSAGDPLPPKYKVSIAAKKAESKAD